MAQEAVLTRPIRPEELDNLFDGHPNVGDKVYKFNGPIIYNMRSGNIAVSKMPDLPPGFGIPLDAIKFK